MREENKKRAIYIITNKQFLLLLLSAQVQAYNKIILYNYWMLSSEV